MQGVRCALELSHRHAVVVDFAITITILWVYSWSPELGNLKPHNDHSYSFFSIERLEVKFLFECILDFRQSRSTRFKTITYPQLMVLQKVKLEELRVVQETHNPQPGTTNSIWICHLQCVLGSFKMRTSSGWSMVDQPGMLTIPKLPFDPAAGAWKIGHNFICST